MEIGAIRIYDEGTWNVSRLYSRGACTYVCVCESDKGVRERGGCREQRPQSFEPKSPKHLSLMEAYLTPIHPLLFILIESPLPSPPSLAWIPVSNSVRDPTIGTKHAPNSVKILISTTTTIVTPSNSNNNTDLAHKAYLPFIYLNLITTLSRHHLLYRSQLRTASSMTMPISLAMPSSTDPHPLPPPLSRPHRHSL